MEIKIVDMTPISYYPSLDAMYSFQTMFPSKNVRELSKAFATAPEAFEHGQEFIRNYIFAHKFGGMGEVIGVTKQPDGYRAVINTYYSFT